MSCMCILHLFTSRMKLRVRKFSDLIEFGLQDSRRVTSILLCFVSIKAWVKNLHIKKYLKFYGYNDELFLQGQYNGQDFKIFGEEDH